MNPIIFVFLNLKVRVIRNVGTKLKTARNAFNNKVYLNENYYKNINLKK
jgi:hypothetical protein